MKPFWKSVWMTPAASGAVAPLPDRPGAGLLRAGGEVGLQAEGVEADAGRAGRGPAPPAPTRLQQLERLLGVELDQLRLELGVEEDRLGRGDQGALARP